MSQAFNMARINEGEPENWGWSAYLSDIGSKNGLDKLVPYLKITKYCGLEMSKDCFPNVTYKYLNGNDWLKADNVNRYAKAKLADGTMFIVESYSSNCEFSRGATKELNGICALIHVDINGYKGPNQLGRDYFTLYLTKNGIMPSGTKNESAQDCSKSGYGFRCAGWVIYKENMDYLKHDVNW